MSEFPVPASSPEELARIERFVAAYNSIDEFLQSRTHEPQTFRSAVDWYARRHPWWRDAETLRTFAALRNFLVHEKTRPFDYPAVPSESAVREMEAVRDRLIRPALLGEDFSCAVVSLEADGPVAEALSHIEKRGLSRFPVYDERHFVGLLTENGIARALAQSVSAGKSFDPAVTVRSILPKESKRKIYRFASVRTPMTEAAFWFHEETFLEAVLLTETGNEHEPLRGIVTRGDVAGRVE